MPAAPAERRAARILRDNWDTLLRLAAPNVLVMLVQAAVGLIETYFVGKLGTASVSPQELIHALEEIRD